MGEESKVKWFPRVFSGVARFKSVFRAFRRGHVDMAGNPLPGRLFHNKKNTCKRKGRDSRYLNTLKKKAYADYRRAKAEGRI
jgi:hypothetical protein